MAGRHRHEDALYRARESMGERILRKLQLEVKGRVLERGDLLLVEGGSGSGGTLACPLQHRQTTLLAGLSTTSPGSVAPRNQKGVWRSGKQRALPTSPHPRRRRDN